MATAQIVSGLDRLLSAEVYAKLLSAAAQQGRPLDEVVRTAIEDYLDAADEPEYEDTPDEQILADLREAFTAALRGEFSPIEELWAEIDGNIDDDAN
jgi:predicted transcriptional regulator